MGFFSPQLSLKQMSILCHQLTTTEKAGVTMKRAFEILEESGGSLPLRRTAGTIAACIEQGATLSQAIHWERKRFSAFFIAMVQVGERTGMLERVFSQLEEYYDNLWKVKLKLNKILTYIFSMLLAIHIGIPILVYFLRGVVTPRESGMVWDISLILLRNGCPFLVMMILIAIILRLPRIRKIFSIIGWFLWPFKRWTRSLAFSRLYEALYLFQQTDIGFQRALPAAGLTSNPRLATALEPASAAIQSGQSLSESLRLVSCMPALDIEMLVVGEISGSLPKTFRSLSRDHYETALYRIRNFAVILSALMIFPFVMYFI